jgi:hypothetical protein
MQAMLIFVIFFASLFGSRAQAFTPLQNQHKDGYVFVLWSSYTDDAINAMLERISQTSAKFLTIPYFGCQTTITSSDVGACSVGSQDQAVHEAELAIAKGFQVTFLPIIATPTWEWRGTFQPTDVNAWFASYQAWLQNLVQIANSLHMSELIVGSEFSLLYQYESQWSALLKSLRPIYAGSLIVTVNWGNDIDYSFWADADAIGISTYFPLTQVPNPTQDELDAGMLANRNLIMSISQKYSRPLYFAEIGFPSTNVAASSPWQALASDGSNFQLQADCYQSFLKVWGNEPGLARASVWATGDLTDSGYATSFETLNKPAEIPIRAFFQARNSL